MSVTLACVVGFLNLTRAVGKLQSSPALILAGNNHAHLHPAPELSELAV